MVLSVLSFFLLLYAVVLCKPTNIETVLSIIQVKLQNNKPPRIA